MSDPVAPAPVVKPPIIKTQTWPHYVLGFTALIALYASGMPRFAQYADVIRATCAIFGLGTVAACKAFLGLRVWSILQSFSPTPAVSNATPAKGVAIPPAVLIIFMLPLLALGACAHMANAPTTAQFTTAFENCLTSEGIQQASPAGAQVWQILQAGGSSSQAIEQEVENIAVTLGGDAAVVCVDCAVIAWDQNNPILPNSNPTPAQVAVRVYKARHLSSPTLKRARAH
jgi:hypothetical protein